MACSLEAQLFSHKHTRTTLVGDRKETTDRLNKFKTENQDSDRQIKTAKTFTSKKDKAHKEMRDALAKLDAQAQSLPQ